MSNMSLIKPNKGWEWGFLICPDRKHPVSKQQLRLQLPLGVVFNLFFLKLNKNYESNSIITGMILCQSMMELQMPLLWLANIVALQFHQASSPQIMKYLPSLRLILEPVKRASNWNTNPGVSYS